MKRKLLQNLKINNLSLFSDSALVILISIVTLLLQIISFVTTWNGSRIYLGDIFPHAALFFALAIQATAYCFSNALRRGRKPLRILALCVALCCSTYYSYIGIYNSVNSPSLYLEENYIRISQELDNIYQEETQKIISGATEQIHAAVSQIHAYHSTLQERALLMDSCQNALEELTTSKSSGLRAPKESSFDTYEEYAAAYRAYISSLSQAGDTERKTARAQTLASYGFADEQVLNTALQDNEAAFSALGSALDTTRENIPQLLSTLSGELLAALENIRLGQPLSEEETQKLSRLFQASQLSQGTNVELSPLISALNQCARVSSSPLMEDYSQLLQKLPEGTPSQEQLMQLKAEMDSQIMQGIMKINSLLRQGQLSPASKQLSYTDAAYAITDLYLLPIQALKDPTLRMTAFFCMGMAALVDLLSVLFAASLPREKPLWKRKLLGSCNMEEYAAQIYACLPNSSSAAVALSAFLQHFVPSPPTEADGYMLCADPALLQEYRTLAALLCQLNLAKLVPGGLPDNQTDLLLLRARFVFWANTIIYKERSTIVAESEAL